MTASHLNMFNFSIVTFLALATICYGKATGWHKESEDEYSSTGTQENTREGSSCSILNVGIIPGSEASLFLDINTSQQTHSDEDNIIVKVSQGSLKGRKVISKKTGGEYYSFQGIPYAQPPVGELRFKSPQEAHSWTGIRDATSEGSICSQFTNGKVEGSEDCLFVNVYTPQVSSSSNITLLPVMVWIHGGGFQIGSGNSAVYGPDFLVNKNVILVTFNYRLGVLGFLGLNNSLVSQNNGLKDQRAALKWVHANIAQFGGDKDQVTIFGQSAGGASVELQVISPSTKGLFHRAISESGNAINDWSYTEPSSAKSLAFLLGHALGLTVDDEDALIKVLKAASVENLVTLQGSLLQNQALFSLSFSPTKEEGVANITDIFLPDSPLNILKSGKYEHVPYMTGFASAEGKMFGLAFLYNESLWKELPRIMEEFVPSELGLPSGSTQSLALAAEIQKMYFGDIPPTQKNIQSLINLMTEELFIQGVRRTTQQRLKTSSTPVYVYEFSYVGNFSVSEFCHYGYTFRGAGHSDELGYLFSIYGVEQRGYSTDMDTVNRMTTMWTNFAKTGNPSEGLNITWDPLTTTSQTYLNIDAELGVHDLKKFRAEKFAFWDKIYANIDK